MRPMRRPTSRYSSAAVALALFAVSAAATAQERGGPPEARRDGSARTSYANPSAVIAAELAFARDAQLRGRWTAFAAAAAPEAVMFVPQMVWAQQWLAGRANPATPLTWQPHEVWSSCDGSLVASRGVWQGGVGQTGWFTTLWQRQPKGDYKWVLDHGDTTAAPAAAPEMIAAHIADCPPRPAREPGSGAGDDRRRPAKPPKLPKPPAPKDLPPLDPAHRAGAANDGSLRWDMTIGADGSRQLVVRWTKDGREQDLLTDRVAAAAANR